MATTSIPASGADTASAVADRRRSFSLAKPPPELLVVLGLSALLSFWSLSANGMANEYYSAAVRSMTTSWRAFFFGSFDASSVMTVDKPPLAFWIQALSVKLFGFSSWSLLAPQALMGVATVGLTYDAARRTFGRTAGFAAGLILALTPISVAISRHNNPDALLVLCSVGAVYAAIRGLTEGRLSWVVWSGVLVGLGFEAKMAAALMVVPGIAAAWLWVRPRGAKVALAQLVAGGAAMVATALAWPVAVWLTPAGSRPWISGTSDNSIWSLIFGYNGLGRLTGQSGGPGGLGGGPGGAGGGPGGGVFGGATGPGRLWNEALGGQSGWLLGAALAAVLGLTIVTRMRRSDARSGWLIAIGGALVVTTVAFSYAAGIFHPYYVSLLAPFIALMIGAAVGVARAVDDGLPGRLLGAIVIGAGVLGVLAVIGSSAPELGWLRWPLVVVGAGAAVTLLSSASGRARTLAIACAGVVLLTGPAIWSVQTLGHPTNGTFPAGGPASSGGMSGPFAGGGPGAGARGAAPGGFVPADGSPGVMPANPAGGPPTGFTGAAPRGVPPGQPDGRARARAFGGGPGFGGADTQAIRAALRSARSEGGGTVAVSSQSGAASQLITDGVKGLVAIGGFSGRESQVTIGWLADAVEAGKIRYVLVGQTAGGLPGDQRVGSADVMAAAEKAGTAVQAVDGLVDLKGRAAALRALDQR